MILVYTSDRRGAGESVEVVAYHQTDCLLTLYPGCRGDVPSTSTRGLLESGNTYNATIMTSMTTHNRHELMIRPLANFHSSRGMRRKTKSIEVTAIYSVDDHEAPKQDKL